MSELSRLQLPDNNIYDLKDTISRNKVMKLSGIYPVIGTQTSATQYWKGNIDIDELYDGLTIAYYLPRASASSKNVELQLTLSDGVTTTASLPVYVTSNTRMTTHYSAGSTIILTYWSAGSISIDGTATTSGCWRRCDYSIANTNTIGEHAGSCTAGPEGMARYSLILQVDESHWESLVTSSSTATNKTMNGHGFLTTSPILYQSAGTYESGSNAGRDGCWSIATNVDSRYSFNCSNSWTTAGKPLYLVGNINSSDGKFYLKSTTWWASALPSTADGYYYWYVGQMCSAYQFTLHPYHPMYYFADGAIHSYDPYGVSYTFAGGTNQFTVTPSNGTAQTITVTPSIANNITGSGTSGYLAQFNGSDTITNGPQIGSSTTTYLRNDGSWATPVEAATTAPANVGTTSSGSSAKYAREDHVHGIDLATGDSNGQVKIAGTNVDVKGLGTAAYTASTAYATSAQGTLADNAMPISGGTFTGAVTMSGDPTANLHAATKQYVDTQISNGIAASDAMVFRGTVGTGGTKTTLPTTDVVIGDTYKAISAINIAAGSSWTGGAVSAKSGDLIVAMASTPTWIVVPSGDETVTTLKYSTTTQNLTTSAQSGALTVGEAATKQVVTSVDTSANLPTSNAVKSFVENKGYVTSSGVTEVSVGIGLALASGSSITSTGTIKAKLKSESGATYDSVTITNTENRQYAVVADASGYLSVNIPWTDTTYAQGTGISISNGIINHSNSVTGGTVGQSTGSSGAQLAIPYITFDDQGHITASGTHTHTISGFLPLSGGTMTGNIEFSDGSYIGITAGDFGVYSPTGHITILPYSDQGTTLGGVELDYYSLYPINDDIIDLGTQQHKWSTVYATSFNGTATMASADANGDVIDTTYRKLNDNSFSALTVTDLTAGNIVATGTARFINGLYGDLIGNASSATNATTVNNHTVNADVPSGAVFTDTTYTNGTGLSLSGTTFNHSNSVAAQTTQAIYPIAIDAQGHISSYGTAVTPLTSHQTIKQDGITGATVNRFGTCSTGASTPQKEVSITTGDYSLEAGARVTVKFSNANTADSPTLKVGSTAAKNIFHSGSQITTGDNKDLLKGVCDFIYDGTQYHLIGYSSYSASTVSVGSASAWSAGTLPTLTLANTTCDDITAWTSNTPTTPMTASVSGGTLTLTAGTAGSAATLSYTERTVGSASGWSQGTLPSLTVTSTTVVNGVAGSSITTHPMAQGGGY